MNLLLVTVGLSKVVFGGLVAALGIWFAFRGLNRLLGMDPTADLARGNPAAGIVHAASLLALGLLARDAVNATFDAVDLSLHQEPPGPLLLARLLLFAFTHVGVSLLVGTGVLALGVLLFDKITPGVEELVEVRRGNVALALVLAAILLVIALLTAPGLQAILNGLIPFPSLPPSTFRAPA
jgi:uncharacterized membrane protein YjfL (UPF0719 family)